MSNEQVEALKSLQQLQKNIEKVVKNLPMDLKQTLDEIHDYIMRNS